MYATKKKKKKVNNRYVYAYIIYIYIYIFLRGGGGEGTPFLIFFLNKKSNSKGNDDGREECKNGRIENGKTKNIQCVGGPCTIVLEWRLNRYETLYNCGDFVTIEDEEKERDHTWNAYAYASSIEPMTLEDKSGIGVPKGSCCKSTSIANAKRNWRRYTACNAEDLDGLELCQLCKLTDPYECTSSSSFYSSPSFTVLASTIAGNTSNTTSVQIVVINDEVGPDKTRVAAFFFFLALAVVTCTCTVLLAFTFWRDPDMDWATFKSYLKLSDEQLHRYERWPVVGKYFKVRRERQQGLVLLQQLPPGWREFQTDTGEAYYYNEQTGVTQWDRPALNASAS
ncbi:hypothetical protein RFI_05979 [Reticulomyxa filosa]|uniref:WW domain-containing protein n=1 Tax=Reticulomyxa filosa TaxID=46433 RepID=X6NZ26_RETFI|nr:hypothetical protein RFI_05979 [Reticulomyxa filosa]|eukprot:ETO31138.1 hypothetical protein RFI_05979 [Reticulomyxa filosa]